MRHIIGVAFLLAAINSETAMAQSSLPDCNVELFKHRESESVRRSTLIYFLDLVTSSNYEQMKQEFKSSWDGMYGFFKTDYDNFKERRAEYRKQIEYKLDEQFSRDFAVLTLNDNGLAAYKACLEAHRKDVIRPILYVQKNTSTDRLVTFVIDLNTAVEPANPARIDLFNVSEVVGPIDSKTKVSKSRDGIHISITGLKREKQFTVRRKSAKEEVRITAEFEGRAATSPILIGPHKTTKTTRISVPISQQGTFLFMARRLHDGSHDFVYQIDGQSMPTPPSDLFRGSACLCASGQRTPATLPFESAGRCVPPKNPSDVALHEKATFTPSHKLLNYVCGGQPQGKELAEPPAPHSICFQVPLSLNAPDQWNSSKTCTVTWTLEGTLTQTVQVFAEE